MPLAYGKSKKDFAHNVKAEMHAGKPQKQALAIAYAVKRKKKMSHGGMASYSKGGMVMPKMAHQHIVSGIKAKRKMAKGGEVMDDDGDDFLTANMEPEDLSYETYPDPDETESDFPHDPADDESGAKKKKKMRLEKIMGEIRARHEGR